MNALDALKAARFVPVLRGPDAASVVAAGRALVRGGCRVLEVALTTPDGLSAIRRLAAEGVPVGAGTVLDRRTGEAAFEAGAAFLVSPHLQPDLFDPRWLYIPGALTPSEVLAARRAGAGPVKVFPVAAMGGPGYLKLLRDPFPDATFFPTGGVTLETAAAYLAAGALAVGVGSALAPAEAIARGDEPRLTALARQWSEAL